VARRSAARVVNSRLRLLLLAILLVFGVLAARAAWIQTVRASSLSALAQAQNKATLTLPAQRGTIFDRLGTPLAIGEQATDVVADPMQITQPRREARIAAKVLGIKAKPLVSALADRSRGFVYVERQAPPALASELAKRNLVGFTFQPSQKRDYPQGTVAASVLGDAGVDDTGLAGLELELNKQLSGTPGQETVVRDALGHVVNTVQQKPAHDGHDVFLTLDSRIQANAEQVLTQAVRQWHAKDATAIVLDPRTGAILAMAQEPGYDANDFSPAYKRGLVLEHAVTDVFEPGSVFKVVTIGGALSEHDVTPQTTFRIPDTLHVADRVIHDAEVHPTETMTVAQILQRSSNIGTVTIAERYLHEDGLKKWMSRFGFGRPTGIDFPGESAGLLPSYWSGSTIGNVPIGQGVSVTAIQLASVYAAIANGGLWIQPHLVDHVLGEQPPKLHRRRILSPTVDATLRNMLRGVVSDQGTAELASIPGYSVAGKTGTAQKPGPNGYMPGKYVATFVGMVPASNPRLLVLVSVDEPHGAIFGGIVAAPAFAQIASFDLQDLDVPPDLPLH
jgi:cell division protein FtsI (penicillin-binding protein 3)/stage V sporulation protein D (sporulation-specific penicillin-binding protein)